jgi:hypothetical protein
MRMPVLGLIPYSEPPTLGTVLEIERMRLRLRAVEAQLEARDSAPPSPAGQGVGPSVPGRDVRRDDRGACGDRR